MTRNLLVSLAALVWMTTFVQSQMLSVPWNPGQYYSGGQAIFDTNDDPWLRGFEQGAYYDRESFEAFATWRAGDICAVGEAMQELIYVVTSRSEGPLTVDIELSHTMMSGDCVSSTRTESYKNQTSIDVTLCFDNAVQNPQRLTLQVQLFRDHHVVPIALDSETEKRPNSLTVASNEHPQTAITLDTGTLQASPRTDDWDGVIEMRIHDTVKNPVEWNRIALTILNTQDSAPAIEPGVEIALTVGGYLAPRTRKLPTRVTTPPRTSFLFADGDPIHMSLPIREVYTRNRDASFTLHEQDDESIVSHQLRRNSEENRMQLEFTWQPPSSTNRALLFWDVVDAEIEFTRRTDVMFHQQYIPRSLASQTQFSAPIDEAREAQNRPSWESNLCLGSKLAGETIERTERIVANHMNRFAEFAGSNQKGDQEPRPAMWRQNGRTIILSDLPGTALGINDDSDVVGVVAVAGQRRPFIKKASTPLRMLDLPPFAISGEANAINDQGLVIGSCAVMVSQEPYRFACLWRPTSADSEKYEIVVLPSPEIAVESCVLDLNNDGDLVGYALTPDNRSQALHWIPQANSYRFVELKPFAVASGINTFGSIVGQSPSNVCTLLQAGRVFDLGAHIPNESGWSLTQVFDVSDHGEISGAGQFDGKRSRFLLRPDWQARGYENK